MMLVNINGPINAGKSTVSKLLAENLPSSVFIEVDELLSDEEQDALSLDFMGGIMERLKRLDKILKRQVDEKSHNYVIFAYPIGGDNYERWKSVADEKTSLVCITLAPDMDVCLTNRGGRTLTDWEKNRIREMYAEGYHCPPETDLIINNGNQSPEETARGIKNFLENKEKSFI